MLDPRIKKLADNIINYSCALKKGEKVLIESIGQQDELVNELVRKAYEVGGIPYVKLIHPSVERNLLMHCTKEQLELKTKLDKELMSNMQAYVGIRGGDNSFEYSDVPNENMRLYQSDYWHTVHGEIRVKKTKWVVMRYPAPSMAQLATKSTEQFEEFYFDVCNLDYSKMNKAMEPLKVLMDKTDKVRLVSKDTDITFSIKGIGAVKCSGEKNLPDGEIYSAPVRDSVNGRITFNTPSLNEGFTFENVSLLFKDGKIIDATCNDTERINKIFDTDEGSRYVGEFAFGVNPFINTPMKDILFDEKIAGSIHFTPGACYDDAYNGNQSAVHWDFVLIQTPEYGGGEIYFDDVLIRKDGKFVIKDLEGLNPENLK